eukprot:3100900-Pyramimonas_sp.AAC.1
MGNAIPNDCRFRTGGPSQRPRGPSLGSPGRPCLDHLRAQFGRSACFARHGGLSPSWGPRGALSNHVGILWWPPRGSW